MAIQRSATTLIITGTGNVVPGPIDIIGVTVPPAGSVTITKNLIPILTLGAGNHTVSLRSANGFTVDGSCTLLLRLDRHSVNAQVISGGGGGGVTDHGDLTGLGDDDHTQYLDNTRADAYLATKDTDDIAEGATNLYFTDARAKSSAVSDDTYNAGTWDGVTNVAPSKNAVRDKVETLLPKSGGTLTGAVVESVVTLTDAVTISVDATLGNVFTVTLGGNRTLSNPTGAVNGQKLVFRIRQDATGSRTLTLDTKFRLGTDLTSVTLTTTANKTDYIGVIYHAGDDKFDVVAFVGGY